MEPFGATAQKREKKTKVDPTYFLLSLLNPNSQISSSWSNLIDDNVQFFDSYKPAILKVVVHNAGEEAYNAQLVVDWPPNVTYKSASVLKTSSSTSSSSTSTTSTCTLACETCRRLKCGLGNPVTSDERLVVRVELETSEVRNSTIFVWTTALSENKEKEETMDDNRQKIQLKVKRKLVLSLCSLVFCA